MLDAYWLAEIYHQHPDSFLALTPDEIAGHIDGTVRMLKRREKWRKENT